MHTRTWPRWRSASRTAGTQAGSPGVVRRDHGWIDSAHQGVSGVDLGRVGHLEVIVAVVAVLVGCR